MIKLLEMTAKREGFGDLLAEGMGRLPERWGVTLRRADPGGGS